jgi:adenylate cyclase
MRLAGRRTTAQDCMPANAVTHSMLRRRAGAALGAALLLALSVAVALLSTRPPLPLAAAERLFDAMAFRVFHPVGRDAPNVVIIGVTEETLAAFPYRSPIDRGFLAEVIGALARAGVRAVGLDVVLDRPSEPEKDAALRRALTRTDIPVVAISLGPDTQIPVARRRFLDQFLAGVRTGDANLARDRFDDMIRDHVPVHFGTGQLSFPARIADALGVPVPDRRFPIEWRRGSAGIGRGTVAPIYPAESIALLPAGWLRGRIALIGSLIPGSDEHRTLASMFGEPNFGVEIHATVLEQLLAGRAVPAADFPWQEFVATAGLAGAAIAIATALAGYLAVAALGGLALLFLVGDVTAYAKGSALLPVIGPVLAMAIAGGLTRAWRGRGERRDRRALRTLFSRFVSEPVVKEIMRERDLFLAGGRPKPQELTATVLYADLAGFTTICEEMQPAPLIAWLDRYIDAMAAAIMAHDGVLLRFIGDGILAVFGVPVPRRDEAAIDRDARNAARCALAMEQAMDRLNDEFEAAGLPMAGLRVGLHTGPLVAGSLGTGARIEFCLLGDTANVGARLEQLGKDYAEPSPRYCTIVIGGPTWDRLAGTFPGILIGEVALRGKRATIAAYRIDSAAAREAVRADTGEATTDERKEPAYSTASERSSSAS